jgi:hypothetical protein
LQAIEELLFYNKDIVSFYNDEFAERLGDFDSSFQNSRESLSKSRRSITNPNLMYQPCFPFDEWKSVALKYSTILHEILQSSHWSLNSRFFGFPSQFNRDVIVIHAVRILLSSLTSYDPEIWPVTLEQLHHLIQDRILFRDSFAAKYAMYILGNLYDSTKLGGKFLVYPCLMKLMEGWESYILSVERTLNPIAWESAWSDVVSLQEFLESSDWLNLYDKYLFKATRTVENEIIGSVPYVTKKYVSAVNGVLSKMRKKRSEKEQSILIFNQRVNDATTIRAEVRKERLSQRLTNYERDNKEIAKVWHFAAQEVNYVRRVWNDPKVDKYYSLDITENQYRMRLRLSRNFDGDNHSVASKKRDRISKADQNSKSSSPFLSLPDRTKIFGQKLTKLSFESGLILEDPDEISQEIEKMILEKSRIYETQSEVCLYTVDCELILFLTKIRGKIEVTNSHLRFLPEEFVLSRNDPQNDPNAVNLEELRIFADHRRPLASLEQVYLRRHNFRNSALEAFFRDGQNFLFNFFGSDHDADKERRRLINVIKGLRLPHSPHFYLRAPAVCLAESRYTEQWINRKISNFEYLMILNTFSGRTYNDLSQYPVFPWILADYTSPKLDLNDPKSFRDLSKPIGAINPDRLNYFLERYSSFEDPNGEITKFLYGSHYSSSATVMFYLLRLEPFTTFHVSLQGGKFDHADRQFFSFANLWQSVTNSTSDVKELIPEFFYLPEFLRNINGYDLGTTQAGDVVGDVALPPWASSPEEFISIHRQALESDYVSQNLHNWIDLIWGYKQRGQSAIDAHNVFYYLTYEDAVNIDAIDNPLDRKSIEDQIHHFGQTPTQLFQFPHPIRRQSSPNQSRRFEIQKLEIENPGLISYVVGQTTGELSIYAFCDGIRIFKHTLASNESGYELYTDVIESQPISNRFASGHQLHSKSIQLHANCKYAFLAGYFDNSFRLYSIEGSLAFVDRVYAHLDTVNCLCISADGTLLATGGGDTTVRLWKILSERGKCTVDRDHKVFYGHNREVDLIDKITDLLVSTSSHLLVSADRGTVLIHPLHHPGSPTCIEFGDVDIKLFQYKQCGDLLILTTDDAASILYRYSINGRRLAELRFPCKVIGVECSNDDRAIFVSTKSNVEVRSGKE